MKARNPMKTCGAKTRKGSACLRAPMRNGRCSKHGGKTPGGIASPHFKNKGRSKYWPTLPKNLKGRFEAASQDPDLPHLRAVMHLLKMRLDLLLARGESVDLWAMTSQVYDDLAQANARKDSNAATDAFARLGELLKCGRDDGLRWREIYKVLEQFCRTNDRELKRLQVLQQYVLVDEVLVMVNVMIDTAKRTITKPDDFQRFARELERVAIERSMMGEVAT